MTKSGSGTKTIQLNYIARVEGEGALYVKLKGKKVEDVQLKIFEPPRFFEGFLRGRHSSEAPDITSRICGICPIAYQMSAIHALENACGISVQGPIRDLRRLGYCGEWIESHALHIFMLHAPDFLGFENAVEMAKKHPEEVQRGLKIKRIGNEIVSLVGGREIHPINFKLGGFYRAPARADLLKLRESLSWGRDAVIKSLSWFATFEFPDFELDYEFVSLFHDSEYPMNEGRLVSNTGLEIGVRDFENHFEEYQVPYSTALQSKREDKPPYLVGPLARVNLCFEKFSPLVKEAAAEIGFLPGSKNQCKNPYKGILARGLEILYACDEAIRIIDQYEMPSAPSQKVEFSDSVGFGCTEAPRGILYHRYQIDREGLIQQAKIVPPTSQNQRRIEWDLRTWIEQNSELSTKEMGHQCERMIRNYDPCISCSTHFLKFNLERSE